MTKICPVCRQPPEDQFLVMCGRCKVPFIEASTLRTNLGPKELRIVASHVLKSPRFWIPFAIGLVAVAWSAVQIVDYAAGRKVQDVVKTLNERITAKLNDADAKIAEQISDRFQEPKIQKLMEDVVTERAVARIDDTADRVIENKIRNEITPRLEKTDSKLKDAQSTLSELQSLSQFYALAARVRSGWSYPGSPPRQARHIESPEPWGQSLRCRPTTGCNGPAAGAAKVITAALLAVREEPAYGGFGAAGR